MNTINYSLLAEAQLKYDNLGFKQIEVPWRVSTAILDVTRPAGCTNYVIGETGKGLLASGEQGFLTLINKGILPSGKYQTITPCFRNEQYDFTHSKQFMKLELIQVVEAGASLERLEDDLEKMIFAAKSTMTQLAGKERFVVRKVETNDPLLLAGTAQYDIMYLPSIKMGDEVEVGSYGIRTCSFGTWIYGTGIAEPRFSKLLNSR